MSPPAGSARPTWAPTASLARALAVGGSGVAFGAVLGLPVLLVLTAPLVLAGALALVGRPRSLPGVGAGLDHASLHEGTATTSHLWVDAPGAEQVTRVSHAPPYVTVAPRGGRVAEMLGAEQATRWGVHRWGRHMVGRERVALSSGWCGYRWGPVLLDGHEVRVLPQPAPYAARAEQPQPRGIVGRHRSARTGGGTELAGIREFAPGDRLRRISWRVSARTGTLHVATTRAEEDAGLLLVLDTIEEYGRSTGVEGDASSLDLTVRAAAAMAEHSVRQGDRVALRQLGGRGRQLRPGTGRRHLRRLTETLADVTAGSVGIDDDSRPQLRVAAGTTVVVVSPVLSQAVVSLAGSLLRRGVPLLVVDTLPPGVAPTAWRGTDPTLVALAWRVRLLERADVLLSLARLGCPVVAWEGPGTVDLVLRRLARHARAPRVVAR